MHIPFDDIELLAHQAGLDDVGVASPRKLEEDATFMHAWVQAGLHGKMHYLEQNEDKRYNPIELVPGAKTIVVGLLSYEHSKHDYHRTMKSALYKLQELLVNKYGNSIIAVKQHIFCDSAPFLERRWAMIAGLGFIGKNHQLIHPTLGSKVHIGELILQTRVDGFKPIIDRTCNDCTLCIENCPTGALREPIWDAKKCTAYHTFHCLTCQDICPFNRIII